MDCPSIPQDCSEASCSATKGSFTRATGRKCGLLEMAEGDSLFRQIGDLPLPLQAKLLRVLEERTIRRVGGAAGIPIDVRVMAATNPGLKDAVAKGGFVKICTFASMW